MVLFSSKSGKMNDDAYLGPSNMQQMMTADSTHVLRRPGIGLSEFAGYLTSALDMLCAIQDHGDDIGLQELTSMLRSSDTILEALQYLNNNNEVNKDDDTMRNHIGTLHDFFTDERSNAIELFSKVSICASRIFVGRVQRSTGGNSVQKQRVVVQKYSCEKY